MDYYSSSYFCHGKGIKTHLSYSKHDRLYPITLKINRYEDKSHSTPAIIFYMSEREFINFKNSIIAEFKMYERERAND